MKEIAQITDLPIDDRLENMEPENDGYIAYREILLEGKELRTEVIEVK